MLLSPSELTKAPHPSAGTLVAPPAFKVVTAGLDRCEADHSQIMRDPIQVVEVMIVCSIAIQSVCVDGGGRLMPAHISLPEKSAIRRESPLAA